MRIGKSGAKNVSYVVSGTQILSETNGTTTTYYIYDDKGLPIGLVYNGVTFTYRKNLQGDIIAILNSAGTEVVNYTYNAWGRLVNMSGSGISTVGQANPFRYRGYYYDSETGYYYLNSRYYDPITGRFLNADGVMSGIGGDVRGYNLYAYCFNNPINMVDYGGNKPGDLFDTMDEAARDFAEYINEKSISVDCEYGSFIYKKTVWETQTITYYNPNIFGNNFLSNLWNYIFRGGLTKTITKRVKVTKYSYVEPKKGTAHSVSIPINWFGLRNKVAEIHTHGAYSLGYSNDNFSSADLNNWINYLVTPLGTVRKYNPADGSDIIIYFDVPYDPNHPGRK